MSSPHPSPAASARPEPPVVRPAPAADPASGAGGVGLPAYLREHPVLAAFALAVLFRVTLFVLTVVHPLADGKGNPVSPTVPFMGTDMAYYLAESERHFGTEVGRLADDLVSFYASLPQLPGRWIAAPPLFPLMLKASGYGAGQTLPLALAYLAMSIALAGVWLRWLREHGLGLAGLLAFALIPNPVWFMLAISTDLAFALFFAVFFVAYFRRRQTAGSVAVWLAALVLLSLTRSASISVLAFTTLDLSWRLLRSRRPAFEKALFVAGYVPVLTVFVLYYLPAFLNFASVGPGVDYYGVLAREFTTGLFDSLPGLLDKAFSALLLIGAKILYFVGLRPSYSEVSLLIVTVRAAVGVVLLPGLVYLLWRGPPRYRLLVGLIVLPLLVGVSQDRYNLPIQPLLFYFGICAFRAAWARLGRVEPRAVSGPFERR